MYETCKKCGITRNTEDMPDCLICEDSFKDHIKKKTDDARQEKIRKMIKSGMTYEKIGKEFKPKISKQRVQQILAGH